MSGHEEHRQPPGGSPEGPTREVGPVPTAGHERRIVTVVLGDLSELTAPVDHMDVDDLVGLVEEVLAGVREVVTGFGGRLDRLQGASLMAVFGAPVAHEDDAQRAIRASLALQRCATAVGYRHGISAHLGVAVHTGPVIAGDLDGGYTVVGEAVNVATRLRALVEPGQILISDATRDRCRELCEPVPLGERRLRGLPAPMRLYEVRELSVTRRGEELGPGEETPLVGRRAQMRQMEHLLAQGLEGQGGVVVAHGDVGVGKSRLALAVRHRAAGLGYRVVSGYADAWDDGAGQSLVARLLRDLVGLAPGEDVETSFSVLRRYLEALDLPLVETRLAMYARYLGLEEEVSERGAVEVSHRETALEALADLFGAAAKQQPLLVIADNLQWASDVAVEALQAVARRAESCHMVVLALTRTPGEARLLGLVPFAHPMKLARLDVRRTGELAAALLGLEEVPPDLARLMAERTGGNPFFIEETVKSLLAEGVVRVGQPVPDLEELHIPTTVQETILSRIDRLDAETRLVLQVASVIGRTFRRDLLGRVLELEERALTRHLDTLEEEQLVFPISAGDGSEYLFRSYVTRDVAYETLSRRSRSRYHEQIALTIESMFVHSLGDHLQTLANHYLETERDDRKGRYLLLAGEAAFRAGNHADGERALLLADEVLAADDEQRDDLDFTLAELYQSQARHAEAVARLSSVIDRTGSQPRRQLALVQRGQNLHQLGEVRQAEDDLRTVISQDAEVETLASAYRELAVLRRDQGRGEAALGYASEAMRVLEGSPNEASIAQAYSTYAEILGLMRRDQEGLEYSQRALEIFERLGARSELARQYNNIGVRYRRAGDLSRARGYYKRCLQLARELGSWREMAHAHHNLGVVHALGGNAAQALASYREALSLREQYGAERDIALTHLAMAEVLRDTGQLEEARESIEKGLATSRRLGMTGVLGPAHGDLAQVLLLMGELQAASEAIAHARRHAREANQEEHLRRARLLEAELLAAQGQVREADRILEEEEGPDTAFQHGKLLLRVDPRRATTYLARAEEHARAQVERGRGNRELLEIQAIRAGLDAALGDPAGEDSADHR